MIERWRDIAGWEGSYQVSDLGRVRSVDRVVEYRNKRGKMVQRRFAGQILTPGINGGRPYVCLCYSKMRLVRMVHLLVAATFLPDWCKGIHVHHKDQDVTNNAVANLECLESIYHMRLHFRGEGAQKAKLTEAQVQEIWTLLESGMKQADIARKYGVHNTTIRDIKQGKSWVHVPHPTRDEAIRAIRTGVRRPAYSQGEGRVESGAEVQP
jgi:hypothetical protein